MNITWSDEATDKFQPTPPAQGATKRAETRERTTMISTHAPRTGGDAAFPPGEDREDGISTHAPRTGGDPSSHVLVLTQI